MDNFNKSINNFDRSFKYYLEIRKRVNNATHLFGVSPELITKIYTKIYTPVDRRVRNGVKRPLQRAM